MFVCQRVCSVVSVFRVQCAVCVSVSTVQGVFVTVCFQAPIDMVLEYLLTLFAGVHSGVVVACSDILLHLPTSAPLAWPQRGVTGLAIPVNKAGPLLSWRFLSYPMHVDFDRVNTWSM